MATLKTYRRAYTDDGRSFLLDNKGNKYMFNVRVVEGVPFPVFSVEIDEGEFSGPEPNYIIRRINEEIPGVIIHEFDV